MFRKRSKVRTKNKPRRLAIDPAKRMLIKQFLIGFLVLLFAGLTVTGIWYGTRLEQLTISAVSIEGGQTISHEQVRVKAEAVLDGSYIGLIPRRFIWLYPHDEILEAIKDVPRMKEPIIEKISATEIKIKFEEYSPYALWCAENKTDECVFIDETGYAFSVAPKLTGGSMVRYHSLGLTPSVGNSFLDADKLLDIARFIELTQSIPDFNITTVEVDSMEDAYYLLAGGGELKVVLSVPAETVFANLESVLAAREFTHLRPGNFQYIDLRYGNKVFVNDAPLPVASTTDNETIESETGSSSQPQ